MLFKKSYESLSKWSTLLVRIGVFAALVIAVVWLVRYCNRSAEDRSWELEKTALRIESIKQISELCTVSFRDEMIMDTVEKYATMQEQINGNLGKLTDYENWKYSMRGSDIKRRLTMIIGGELRFGFDLKKGTFELKQQGDTAIVTISEPKILDVLVLPSKTSVFHEHGEWSDEARRKLQRKAIKEISTNAAQLDLADRSKKQLELLLKKLIGNQATVILRYI